MAVMPEFRTIRLVPKSSWYVPGYLKKAQPGDVLLLGEIDDRTGGILRIKRASVFVTLDSGQVWAGKHVAWPREQDGIDGFTIQGNQVLFTSK